MGVEYELHDTKNKRRFDLGKGAVGGYFVRHSFLEIKAGGEASLVDGLKDHWLEEVGSMNGEPLYFPALARLIWQFCEEADWKVYWISDTGDMEEEGWRWPITHTRFRDEKKINPWKYIE